MQAAPLKCQVQCGETRIYTLLVQRKARTEWNESLKSVQLLLSSTVRREHVIDDIMSLSGDPTSSGFLLLLSCL